MDTPQYSLRPAVYEPSEDTFLLLDTLEQELPYIRSLQPTLLAEIGSGSGVCVTALSAALKHICFCFATDINVDACLTTRHTANLNGQAGNVDCINVSLLHTLKCQFDVIVFNPPYVVTPASELSGAPCLRHAWAGGPRGRLVMDQLFPLIPQLLTPNGVFYLLVIKENNPAQICTMFQQTGFNALVINDRKIRGEHLHVIKIHKLY